MSTRGIYFQKADNARTSERGALSGWDAVRQRLIGINDIPLLYFFSTCTDMIRTIPMAQHDPDRPEDLMKRGEDHCLDQVRYACMSRPFFRSVPQEPRKHKILSTNRNECSMTMNDLWEAEDRRKVHSSRI
jgi:hypothetical protein